ncbi:HNH endonuclease [Nocardia beijingensis]|uniref:HNH endonuclease n=1 Tax=Nocardia beijingensis TaxID=95162 RepID=UPI00340041E9
MKRTGLLEKPPAKPCDVSSCDRQAKAKGLCQRHYDIARAGTRRSNSACSQAGCDKEVAARGLCRSHYSTLQRNDELSTAPLQSRNALREVTVPAERRCRGCGGDLAGLPPGRRYCTDSCKPRCSGPGCDRKVSGRGLCSTHLRQSNQGEELREISRLLTAEANGSCEWCGEPVGVGSRSRFCSWNCRSLRARHAEVGIAGSCSQCGALIDYLAPANGSSGRLTPISKKLCDECRHRSASLYLSADDLRIRDGDLCSICGLEVPENLPDRHPLVAQVDHIVPIARGGTHDPDNLALAHKTCNIAKRDKPAGWRRNPSEVEPVLAEWRAAGIVVAKPLCSAPGCDRKPEAVGMCQKHRRRFLNHGSCELPAKPTLCSAEDCDSPIRARGLCRSHYRRWQNSRTRCTESDCTSNANTRGLCKSHYRLWLRNRMDHPVCSDPSCVSRAEVLGLCQKHYDKQRRTR